MEITDKKEILIKIQEMADAGADIEEIAVKSGNVNYSICTGGLFLEWFDGETVSIDNDGCFNGKFIVSEINLIKIRKNGDIRIEVGN